MSVVSDASPSGESRSHSVAGRAISQSTWIRRIGPRGRTEQTTAESFYGLVRGFTIPAVPC
jgi:hypothetical protein